MTAPQRFAYIDSMRAIAALMVLVLHTGQLAVAAFPSNAIDTWILTPVFTLDFGRAGVLLFFAISGYVIPASLRGPTDRINFPVRRFFRLYPAYWLSILVLVLISFCLGGTGIDGAQVIANISMLQTFLGYDDLEGLYWTLAVELVFYVACYGLFLAGLIGKGNVLGGIALALASGWYLAFTAAAGPFQSMHFLVPDFISDRFMEWPAYFSIMFWSAACRQVADHRATPLTISMVILLGVFWLVVVPATGLFVYVTQQHDAAIARWALMKYGAFALGLYAFVGLAFVIRIRSPVLGYLGTISFSLYLFHPAIMRLLATAHATLTPDLPVTPILFVGLCALATIAFSAIVYRYIEAPAISLGTVISAGLVNRRNARTTLDRLTGT